MVVQPFQLFGIELRCRGRDVVEIEPFAELRHREHFVITMRPAQARQIIDDRFRQIAFV